MTTIRIIALAVLIVAHAPALPVVQAQQAGATRTELQRHDLSMPGREVIQVRVDLAPDPPFQPTHPRRDHLRDRRDVAVPNRCQVGDGQGRGRPFHPARAIHSAKNVGSGKAAELATYLVEKGQPLLTLVE